MGAIVYPLTVQPGCDEQQRVSEVEIGEGEFGIANVTKIDQLRFEDGPAVVGGYFHRRNRKRFVFATGWGILITQDVDYDGNPIGERVVQFVAECAIVVPPRVAYTFIFYGAAILLCFSTRKSDQNDMQRVDFGELPTVLQTTYLYLMANGERLPDGSHRFPEGEAHAGIVAAFNQLSLASAFGNPGPSERNLARALAGIK